MIAPEQRSDRAPISVSLVSAAVCTCEECRAADRRERIADDDPAGRRQLRLPIHPLAHLAGEPAGPPR